MAVNVFFPDTPPASWDSGLDYCIWFPAIRDETRYSCLVTSDFLSERFGIALSPEKEQAMTAFEKNRLRIQDIARTQIAEGRFSKDRKVLIKSDTFAFKNVTFSDKVRQSPYYFRLCRRVTAELEEVVEGSAHLTTVEWDRTQDAHGRDLYVMVVRDFTESTSVVFSPGDMESNRFIRGRLYRVWGDLLQDRSHRQLSEMLSGRQEGNDAP